MDKNGVRKSFCKEMIVAFVFVLISFLFVIIFFSDHRSVGIDSRGLERAVRMLYGQVERFLLPLAFGFLIVACIIAFVGFRKCLSHPDKYSGMRLGCVPFDVMLFLLVGVWGVLFYDWVFFGHMSLSMIPQFFPLSTILLIVYLIFGFCLKKWMRLQYEKILVVSDDENEKEDSTSE